ncbi:hypothetical protein F4802DRAFT_94572 [Xylaria palmicola]|nr:hypothetical protein F4802DRAFT_94572 [Xylaria palmicola]
MGIHGLSSAVRRYGEPSRLSGDTVVIDGPCLIYQILDGCIGQIPSANGFLCYPSYSTLGQMVVGWLEALRRHNVTVRKIYFDGYLPPSKWRVRQERLLRQSQTMKDLRILHPHGSPRLPADALEMMSPGLPLTQHNGNSPHSSSLPKPPFLVPATIEILRNCPIWGPRVEVVSGEADMFCADDVRRHGGVLLSNDSDLLITDLGPDGTMSFFSDIVEDAYQGLATRKFSLRIINDAWGLNHSSGLPRVAFEKVNGWVSYEKAIQMVRNNNVNHDSSNFRRFMEEYTMKEYLPKDHPVQGILSNLDPRISETVIQTLLPDGNGTTPLAAGGKNARGPETLAMFLPIMIEDRSRKSSWTMSTDVRQLAYGILQTFAVHPSPAVIEYRLLEASNSSMGRYIDVLESGETLEQCTLLINTLKQLIERMPSINMHWLAFAIYQDIVWSRSEQRSPLSASLLSKNKQKSNNADECSWNMIHFTAQVHASLYSLRMVKQTLEVAASLRTTLPTPMRELLQNLSALPTLAEWPTVENLSQALHTAGEANVLSAIADILGIPEIEKNPAPSLDAKRRSKKRKEESGSFRSERRTKRPASDNPFAILSGSGE